MAPQQGHPGERKLLENLDACFQLYETFDVEDQEEIRQVLTPPIPRAPMEYSTAHAEDLWKGLSKYWLIAGPFQTESQFDFSVPDPSADEFAEDAHT